MIRKFSRSKSVQDVLEEADCDPVLILAGIANGNLELLQNVTNAQKKTHGLRIRMEAAIELTQYLHAKIKPVEKEGSEAKAMKIEFVMHKPEGAE